ncbi:MAG TPA: GerMN domain-containing protein [Arachnia sp.]|nr:GerMN domain-containing protein [Arachnia sp.]
MRLLLAALLGVVLVTGCTHIPTAGPVEEVPVSAEPRGIDIAPQPPVAGMLPARLVDGFLQAMASPEGDYAIARQYLTDDAAQRWEPIDAVVFDGLVVGGAATATLDATQLGTIDQHGRYSSEPRDLEHDFGVVNQDGEWRIASPLPSLMVSRYIFERYYERVPLYFMSRSGTHVVPDPIHLPEMLVTPTAVVEALLNGPSEAIDQAVTDAIPSGISLSDEGATIDQSGVVTVNFEGLFDRLGDDARRRLGAQLLWSLTAIPRVTGLVVTSGGVPFTLPGARADGALELASQQGYQILSRAATVDLFGIREGTPGRVTGESRFEPWEGTVSNAADLAVSLDGDTAALIDATRRTLLMGSMRGEFGEVEVPVTNLRSPQFVLGTLWVMGDDAEGVARLLTVDRMGSVTEVQVSLPEGRELEDFAVSPAQARAALLLSEQGTRTMGIATVVPVGEVEIVDWRALPMMAASGDMVGDVLALAWHAETSIAVAGSAGGVRSVFAVEVDGSLVEELGPFTGAVEELTAMARLGGGSIALRTDAGVTWRYEARTRWTRLAEGITAIAYAS